MNKTICESLISQRIKEARERIGYNQAQLARMASITPAAISQIEKGERMPSIPILQRLASALKVSTDYLLGNTNEVEYKDILHNDTLLRFIVQFHKLKPLDQEFIEKQVELLTSR